MAYNGAKKTSISYVIELTKTNNRLDISVIHDKDDFVSFEVMESGIKEKPLYKRLEDIEGIYDVDYNGHFGNRIFLTLNANVDESGTWKKIQECIGNYLKGEDHGI